MSDNEQGTTVLELLLREPEIVAWLDDYRPAPTEGEEDDEPPTAA
jgi:hypothetical protein